MDLSAIIVIIVLSALFFGALIWMAIHSRRTGSGELPADGNSKAGLRDE